ncbi:hypothetical protein ACFV1F_13565, partial [Streptomyces sp. NPDC059590]|uniref:hypothetical protein n=1 Tax=Streptomyces sp. NPDC059590 TaxID=3346877 RepID=UPI0036A176A4
SPAVVRGVGGGGGRGGGARGGGGRPPRRAPRAPAPAYDSGDHLHPGDAGLQAMADAIDLRQLTG